MNESQPQLSRSSGDQTNAGENAKCPPKVTQQGAGEFQEVVFQGPKAGRWMWLGWGVGEPEGKRWGTLSWSCPAAGGKDSWEHEPGLEVSGQGSEAMPRPPLPQPQMASLLASRLPPSVPFTSLPDLCRLFSTDQMPRGVFIKHKSEISLFYLKLSCNLLTKRCISTIRPVFSAPLVSGLVSCTLYLTHVSAHKLALT